MTIVPIHCKQLFLHTEYHKVLPSSAKDEVRCDCTFADDGNAS